MGNTHKYLGLWELINLIKQAEVNFPVVFVWVLIHAVL